jgi:hypothetical protein
MIEVSQEAFRQVTTELMEVVQKSARLQADLFVKLEERYKGSTPEPAVPKAISLASTPQTERIEKSLDKVARQLEILARELDRNNSMLFTLASAHSFYRSMIHKPMDWWNSFLRFFSRLRMGTGGVS